MLFLTLTGNIGQVLSTWRTSSKEMDMDAKKIGDGACYGTYFKDYYLLCETLYLLSLQLQGKNSETRITVCKLYHCVLPELASRHQNRELPESLGLKSWKNLLLLENL